MPLQIDTLVKDVSLAINFFLDGEFKNEDDDMSLELISIIVMQLSQQQRDPKMASEVFKVISYIIFNLQEKQVISDTTDIIARLSVWQQK